MKVVPNKSAANGAIDMDDLKAKIDIHKNNLVGYEDVPDTLDYTDSGMFDDYIPLKSAANGAIDMDDLKAKIDIHKNKVVGYEGVPGTLNYIDSGMIDDHLPLKYAANGVFETTVSEICSLVHDNGGQVEI